MPTFGSSTSPSFAGWDWPGAQYAFAALYTSPAQDIYITTLHAYFDTVNGSGAHGYLCIWDGNDVVGNPLLAITPNFVVDNGSKSPGGQRWWVHSLSSPLFVPASSKLWLGAYCDQGLLFSTYGSTPKSFVKPMGTTINPSFFNSPYRSNTGQGPPGVYADYSPVVYGSLATVGNRGGGIQLLGGGSIIQSSATLGNRGGGLFKINSQVILPSSVRMGNGSQSGLLISGTNVTTPKIWIWRPR
jgi:hypothetical protein